MMVKNTARKSKRELPVMAVDSVIDDRLLESVPTTAYLSLAVTHEGGARIARSDGTGVPAAFEVVPLPPQKDIADDVPIAMHEYRPNNGTAAKETSTLEIVGQLARTTCSSDSLQEIIVCAVDAALRVSGAAGAAIYAAEPDGTFRLTSSAGFPQLLALSLEQFLPWPTGEPLVTRCISNPGLVPELAHVASAIPGSAWTENGIVCLAIFPIIAHNRLLGTCVAQYARNIEPSSPGFKAIEAIAAILGTVIDRSRQAIEIVEREEKTMSRLEMGMIDRTRELSDINRILMTEITERKRTEEQLKEEIEERRMAEESLRVLSHHLVNAQESERRRLAQELHDGVNQILSATKLRILGAYERINAVKRPPDYEERLRTDIDKARSLLEESINEIRHISKNLRPSILDHLGLVAALRVMCDELQQAGYAVEFKSGRMPAKLSGAVDVTLYRIIQECTTNIMKHSGATTIELRLNYRNDQIEAVVRDNGRGFNLQDTERSDRGYGLVSMKERALYVGGSVSVSSRPGKGTQIEVRIPFHQHHSEGTQE